VLNDSDSEPCLRNTTIVRDFLEVISSNSILIMHSECLAINIESKFRQMISLSHDLNLEKEKAMYWLRGVCVCVCVSLSVYVDFPLTLHVANIL
jgi:hypothetical protein